MKAFKRTIYLMLTVIMLFGIALMTTTVTAKAATLNRTSLSIYPGKTYTLKLEGKTPKWSSSDSTVASVSTAGKVKARKTGTCTITAKVGTKKYTCKVTVKKYSVTTIKNAWKNYWAVYKKGSGGACCYYSYERYSDTYVYYKMRSYTGYTFNICINRYTGKVYEKFSGGYDPAGNVATWQYTRNIAKYL